MESHSTAGESGEASPHPEVGAEIPSPDLSIRENTSEEELQPEVLEVFSHLAMHLDIPPDEYGYRPLGTPSTLRLIKVMPDKVNGFIACRIYTFDIQKQPGIKYEALSYF
ncbi:hypothetical protein VP1G_07117 [Cytospora mali]|uniref:Uncharacterized protein n=1 Tax=Cytospora mali TaxID=578113 RepID=A0A194V7I4_CYTMA|nr:hypothetical protein VP1G_07117 [Valsa mali var. pyri (nom. inval.)]